MQFRNKLPWTYEAFIDAKLAEICVIWPKQKSSKWVIYYVYKDYDSCHATWFLVDDDDDDEDDCFSGIVDQRKAFSLISSRNYCERSAPSRISDTPRAGFEPAPNL